MNKLIQNGATLSEVIGNNSNYKRILDDFAIVAETDPAGVIRYVNQKFCEISQYHADELIGQNHRILNSGHHGPEFWENFWKTITAGKKWRAEVCNRAKDGSLYWVDTMVSPLFDNENKITGYMAVRIDLTEKKKIQEQLEQERQAAAISAHLAAVGELSANIAHEINNPLFIISSASSLIHKKVGREKDLLITQDRILKAVDRISKIIKGLKRVVYHKADNDWELIDLKDLMTDTVEFSRELLKSKGIDLRLEEIPDVKLKCRSSEFVQVILNLLTNARDEIENLSEKWIKIELHLWGDKLRINVIDSGKGIPTEIREKILKPFYTTKSSGKGTGLGLSLSRRIITEHGGELFLDENHEHTCFSIILPLDH